MICEEDLGIGERRFFLRDSRISFAISLLETAKRCGKTTGIGQETSKVLEWAEYAVGSAKSCGFLHAGFASSFNNYALIVLSKRESKRVSTSSIGATVCTVGKAVLRGPTSNVEYIYTSLDTHHLRPLCVISELWHTSLL